MSIRRPIQKKINNLLKDFISIFPEVLEIVEHVDNRTQFIDLILNPDGAIEYPDVESLKADADETFKLMSKVRGKRKEAADMASAFDSSFNAAFMHIADDDAEPVADDPPRAKRGRPRAEPGNESSAPAKKKAAVEDIAVEEPSSSSASLPKAMKSALKQIVAKVSKLEYADIFMYPVDSSMFPEYYEVIQHPMDLMSIKNKVNTYTTIDEALADIRLIWENCRTFNSDESDIVQWANSLADATEALIEEHLGSDYKLKKKASRKKAADISSGDIKAEHTSSTASAKKSSKASKMNDDVKVLPKKVLLKIINDVKNHECGFPFLYPVSEDDAPGYSDMIKEPMDLTTAEKRVKAGAYESELLSFVNDVNLIWKNCVTYNDPSSSIAEWARIMAQAFAEKVSEASITAFGSEVSSVSKAMKRTKADLVAAVDAHVDDNVEDDDNLMMEDDAPVMNMNGLDQSMSHDAEKKKRISKHILKFKKGDLSPLGRMMWALVDDIKEDPASHPFHFPINLKAVPNYLEIVTNPMDLFTLKSKIPSYLLDESPYDAFYQDLLLIFDNCKKFNQLGSELHQYAVDVEKVAVEKFASYFKKNDDGSYTANESAVKKRKYKTKKSLLGEENDHDMMDKAGSDDEDEGEFSNIKSSAEIDKVLAILRSEKGPRALSVRNKAIAKSRELVGVTVLPWIIAPNLYEIQSLGAINNNFGYHDAKYVYPPGYRSTRMVHIQVVPIDPEITPPLTKKNFIPIALTSTILAAPGMGPRFVLTIDGGTVITQGINPREPWIRLFDNEAIPNLFRMRCDRLKHCRSLLNRLSVDSRATHLIDRNTMDETITTYSCSIWFRKIHDRLQAGFYDNEFDFAWDVRHIFHHIISSEPVGSSLRTSTIELKDMFEYYFCKWVINYQHRSSVDLARGAWEDWASIRLYDDPTYPSIPSPATCQLCHNHVSENLSISHPHPSLGDSNVIVEPHHQHHPFHHLCHRCQVVMNEPAVPSFETASSATQQRHNISYQREEANLSCFIPNPELGDLGWCQALRQRRGGLKGVYLSPLGFHIKDKTGDYLDKIKEYEAMVDERMTKELVADVDQPVMKPSRRRDMGISTFIRQNPGIYHWSYQTWTSELEACDDPVVCNEDMRIIVGELMNYHLPDGYRYAITIPSTDKTIIPLLTTHRHRDAILAGILPEIPYTSLSHASWEEITIQDIPAVGYFGLDIPDVKIRVEGLPAIELCHQYNALAADFYRQLLIEDLLRDREVIVKQEELERSVLDVVQNERYYHDKTRMHPTMVTSLSDMLASSPDSVMTHLESLGFTSLFKASLSIPHGEVLLCVWDLLDLISSMAGDWTFSLQEVLSSLDKSSHSLYTSVGDIIYDEILCLFTGILLQDLFSTVHDLDIFQTILTAQPLNLITWPAVMRSLTHASRTIGWTSKETTELMLSPEYDSWQAMAIEVLMMIAKHPITKAIKKLSSSGQDTSESRAASDIIDMMDMMRDKIYHENHDVVESIQSFAKQYMDELQAIQAQIDDTFMLMLCKNLRLWLAGLLHRWHIIDNNSMQDDVNDDTEISIEYRQRLSSLLKPVDDLDKDMMLQPHHFLSNPTSLYEQHLVILQSYERSLSLLRSSDPDTWSADDKNQILIYAMDMVCSSNLLISNNKDRKGTISQYFNKIDDVPMMPSPQALEMIPYHVVSLSDEETQMQRCCYTGSPLIKLHALAGNTRSSPRYVIVPSSLLDPPHKHHHQYVKADVPLTELQYEYHSQPHFISMESFIHRIIAAREVAIIESQKHDAHMMESFNSLAVTPITIAMNTASSKPIDTPYLRSQPLGYDRYGNQYWLFAAQDSMTIDVLGRYTLNPVPEPAAVDPMVLVKHPNGWWGKHTGLRLQALVSSFTAEIACERILRDNMITRLLQARYRLYSNTMKPKAHQREWLARRIKAEELFKDIIIIAPSLTDTAAITSLSENQIADITKQQELIWSRASEIRQYVQYSMLLKKDYDVEGMQPRAERDAYLRRQKRIRESNADDSWDLHPTKGWLRFHCLSHVRELAVCTTATRIHADMTLLPLLRENHQKSVFRNKWMHRTTKQWEAENAIIAAGGTAKQSSTTSSSSTPTVAPMTAPTSSSSSAMNDDVDNIFQDDELLLAAAGNNSNNKAVAQLHPVTGDVLRIHPSGKVAAAFMGVSPAGISLCCSGKHPEAFGFRWRFYDGPAIDWEALKDKQMNRDELQAIAAKHKRGGDSSSGYKTENVLDAMIPSSSSASSSMMISTVTSSNRPPIAPPPVMISSLIPRQPLIPTNTLSLSSSYQSNMVMSSSSQPSSFGSKLPPNFIASTVLVSSRLMKLKAEIINLLLILPEKQLKWPDQPDDNVLAEPSSTSSSAPLAPAAEVDTVKDEVVGQDMDTNATVAEAQPSASSSSSGVEASSIVAVAAAVGESAEEKALRKKKRRDKRRGAFDRILIRIQTASTANDLFSCMLSIEEAMPASWTLAVDQLQAQDVSSIRTAASVAIRLFAIDRAIRYDEIPGIDTVASKLLYRARTQFVPRCMVAVTCRGCMNHASKQCGNFADVGSRYPEISDIIAPPPTMMSHSSSTSTSSLQPSYNRGGHANPNAYPSAYGQHGMTAGSYGGQPSYPSRMGYGQQQPMPGYRAAVMPSYTSSSSRSRGGNHMAQEEEDEDFDEMDSTTRKKNRSCVHIEFTQPYMPPSSKITMVEWI